jgi:hypothetical protein
MSERLIEQRCPPVAGCRDASRLPHGRLRLMVDVTIEAEVTAPGEPPILLVKLQSSAWELNVRATREDLLSLQGIRDAVWVDRRSLHVGTSAGAPVQWSASGDITTVMVGDDDETWDIAIQVPTAAIEDIVTAAAQQT